MSLFKVEKKIIDAHFPRFKGSTIHIDDKLKIVYNKFSSTTPPALDKIRINLVFSHGTGMNKELWNYHIEKLYQYSAEGQKDWYLGSVIAFDCASHGDSALLNNEKLGWTYGWFDGAKDLIKIVKHENDTNEDFLNNRISKNIIIGHSLGGHHVIMAGFLEPLLFDTIIPIEPVYYGIDQKLFPKFVGRFSKISGLIMDEFESLDDYKEYYTKYSFTKDFQPKVLQDLVDNDYYQVYDAEIKTTKYRSKTSKISQMATYLSSYWALERSTTILPLIECKICYIWGEKATWNPPGTEEYFINHASKDSLLEYHCVKDGTHLLNGELPDVVIGIIQGVINKRSKAAIEDKDYYPEIKFKGDRNKMIDHFSDLLLNAKMQQAVHFSKDAVPQPKYKI